MFLPSIRMHTIDSNIYVSDVCALALEVGRESGSDEP